jgi:hypothetical protein
MQPKNVQSVIAVGKKFEYTLFQVKLFIIPFIHLYLHKLRTDRDFISGKWTSNLVYFAGKV